jgi:hypothetical protein
VSFIDYRRVVAAILFVVVCRTAWVCGEDTPPAAGADQSSAAEEVDAERVPLDVARDRARLLHRVYAATLDAMHEHYFDVNRSVLPARAMEDVFAELSDQSRIKARWISVNTPAMSITHEPRTPFEKEAAQAIAAGKPFHEQVETGTYLRASPIPLAGGCVSCHMGFSRDPGSKPRFAGLVISIPIQDSMPTPGAK